MEDHIYNYPMAENLLDSTQAGRARSICYPASTSSDQLKEYKLRTGGPHQPASNTRNISYLCTSSTQHCQCLPSFLLMKPRMDYSSQTSTTSSLKQDLGKDVDFSNVLRASRFLKSTCQGDSTTLPTNNTTVSGQVEEIKASKVAKAAASAASITCNGSSHGGLQGLKHAQKLVSFVLRNQEIPPDEQSETVGHNCALRIHGSEGHYHDQTSKSADLKAKGKANYYYEPLSESSSVCSLGASHSTNLCSSRKHDDIDDSTYLSDKQNDEESKSMMKDKLSREGTSVKRSRSAKIHNLYERKRRDRINKKMRILKELIPDCSEMDKASMLDDAIEYLKILKFQLQIMSMGLCMPLVMLPTATHHMINFNTPHLPQLMGAGMGFRPGTGTPCSLLPQSYPIIAPLPVINDHGVRMFGFPNQVPVPLPPMPISRAPFIPISNTCIMPMNHCI